MVAGVLLGLWLLSLLRVEVPQAETELTRSVQLEVRRPARPPPQLPVQAPTEVQRAVEPPPEVSLDRTDAFEETGELAVRFVTPRGDVLSGPLVQPIDCPGLRFLEDFEDAEGPGRLYAAVPGSCALRGVRMDGALQALSDVVRVHVADGGLAEVRLVLPEERTGGIGVSFRPRPEGMVVMRVVPGSPAHAAGLAHGDVIVEVDGLPTAMLTSEDFVSVMTGPEGTDVEFTVELHADTGLTEKPLVVQRAFLEG